MSFPSQPIALTPSTAGFSSTFPPEDVFATRTDRASVFRGLWKKATVVYENNIGLLLMIASQLSGTCMNITVKILNELDPPIPTFEIIFIRMSITYVFSILYMRRASVPYPVTGPPGVRYFLAIRGVTGFFGLFGIYYSLIYLSLSDAI
ncbi:hypothetical protein FRC19_008771, partial [Serendipita sp. 401]